MAVTVVRVELGERTYAIHIGPGARAVLQKRNAMAGAAAHPAVHSHPQSQVVVIADQAVADLHGPALLTELPRGTPVLTFPAGEASKSLATAGRLYEALAAAHIDREALVIAFGGGVAGDLGGFIAATWMRGVPFVQVPTTLLAAVDASVGGKTAVNLPAGKNLVGAFHQPRAVIIDTDFLHTLPQREFAAGLAESVKHAAIRDPELLAWHEQNAGKLVARDAAVVGELIARNCAIKAAIVAQDEREAGLRAILNYGHTIGHALEHLLDYELRHGECVALGMLVENELARARGLLSTAEADRIRVLLAQLGLPDRLPRPILARDVANTCRVDKKARSGAVHFVLLKGLGEPTRVADVTDDEIAAALAVIAP